MNVIRKTCEKAGKWGGSEVQQNGTKLFGHQPHEGSHVWFHVIYAPLSKDEINRLEDEIKIAFPKSLEELYSFANGLHLFSTNLAINGLQRTNSRDPDNQEPFAIQTPNVEERPSNAQINQLFIGNYLEDLSKLVLDIDTEKVFRCSEGDPLTVLNEWGSIGEMFESEIARLSSFFNEKGEMFDEDADTTPPNIYKSKK